MDFPEVRKFLLASYHDMPNILFMGSLILGSLLGYLPLVWVALGLVMNGAVTAGVQLLVKWLREFPAIAKWDQRVQQLTGTKMNKCSVGFQINVRDGTTSSLAASSEPIVTPSYWMSASTFFAVFSIYNSIRVANRDPKGKVDPLLVSTRKAFSLSTLLIGIFFLLLIFARGFTGCESLLGGVLGVAVGAGVAIGFWHMLDSCGTGKLPDILQVVGSMAPDQSKSQTPVMCTAAEDVATA